MARQAIIPGSLPAYFYDGGFQQRLTTAGLVANPSAVPAGPVIAATNSSDTTTTSATHTVLLPANIGAGELLIAILCTEDNVTFTLPATWAGELVEVTDGNGCLYVIYKFASGSEGASVVITSSGATNCSHLSARWTGAHASTPPELGTVTTVANSTSHDPTGVTPSWGAEDTQYMPIWGWRNSARTITTWPANYASNRTTKANSAGGNKGALAFATWNLNATSEDPGALTLSASSVGKCLTLAIRPSAATAAAFAGTIAATFAQTGALNATSTHAGTSVIAFNQTGALTSQSALAGTSAITFGQTGAFVSTSKFAGTSAVVFSQIGALKGNFTGAGTTTVTFNQSGNFIATTVGDATFNGTISASFGQTGNLKSAASSTGTATLVFAQTGAFTARAAFIGTTPVVFDQSGDFVAGSFNPNPTAKPAILLCGI